MPNKVRFGKNKTKHVRRVRQAIQNRIDHKLSTQKDHIVLHAIKAGVY